jgi:hypothetical protein
MITHAMTEVAMSNPYRALKMIYGMILVLTVIIFGVVDAYSQAVDLSAKADHGDYVDMGDGIMIERFDSPVRTGAVRQRPPRWVESTADYYAVWDEEDIRLTYQNEEGRSDAQSPRGLAMGDTLYIFYNEPVSEPYSHGVVSLVRLFEYSAYREYPVQVTDTTTGYILFTRLLHVNDGAIHIVAGGTHLHDMNDRFIHYSLADINGLNWQLRETWYDDDLRPNFRQGGGIAKGDTLFYTTDYLSNLHGQIDSLVFVRSLDGGRSWSDERFISVEYNSNYGASLQFTQGRLHYVGQVNEPRIEIGYHYSDDLGDTWHYWGALSSPDTISSQWPSLAADGQGNMCACWFDYKYGAGPGGISGTLLCRKSTDNGETWSEEFIASDTNTVERSHLYLEGDYIMAVWFDHRDDGWLSPHIYYAESHDFGETWTPSREIMDQTSFKNKMEFEESDGHLYLFWTDGRDGMNEIYFKHGMLSPTSVKEDDITPSKHSMLSAYPNPFNSSTAIRFDLSVAGEVDLTVFDIMGRRVATLIDGRVEAGRHIVTWDASAAASGIYFCMLTAGNNVSARRMTLLK